VLTAHGDIVDRVHAPDVKGGGGEALTLLVVPALYSLWFRVRGDETADAFDRSEHTDHFDQVVVPIRIAAE
jgi:hypothetical protein